MEEKKDLSLYPRLLPKPIKIEDMSKGYIKTQLEKIKHTGINSEYEKKLKKELKVKNKITFKHILL